MARGIVRKIDELGRITLPMEYRRSFGIEVKDLVGMYVEGQVIHLVKADKNFKGIARHEDELGRLTLPKEIRRTLGFGDRQEVDMWVEGEDICIAKYGNSCLICGSTDQLLEVEGIHICRSCAVKVYNKLMEV